MTVQGGDPRVESSRRRTRLLDGGWGFRKAGDTDWMPARIPGSNFGDLQANGLIDDANWRDNEQHLQWIEKEDWEYRCLFEVSDEDLRFDSLELVFEGLDTLCDVALNGSPLLVAENMFLTYRAEVR
ncbi:MAG TPA: hypothetical protein VM711_03360, partial [Sphingomicrobium sp.]|nr:hypothetical protein [Sphingomicrobium sp.]